MSAAHKKNAAEQPQILRDFLIYMETIRGKSEKTIDEYFLDLRMFFRFMKRKNGIVPEETEFDTISISDIDIKMIRDITLSDAYEFLNYTAKERLKHAGSESSGIGLIASSRARKISALRSFFRYLTDKRQLLEYNPIQNLDYPSIKKSLPQYLSVEDSIKLLESVEGPYQERDYCILTIFLNCGLRVSELVGLNTTDIQDDQLRVLGKGNKERMLYLNEACLNALEAYFPHRLLPPPGPDKNALFVSRNRRRISARTVKWLVEKYIIMAGLDPEKYSAHKLRHTAATLMYQNGVDIRTLQDVLGHTNLNTTMIYTHIEDSDVRTASKLNPLSHIVRKKKEENPPEEDK